MIVCGYYDRLGRLQVQPICERQVFPGANRFRPDCPKPGYQMRCGLQAIAMRVPFSTTQSMRVWRTGRPCIAPIWMVCFLDASTLCAPCATPRQVPLSIFLLAPDWLVFLAQRHTHRPRPPFAITPRRWRDNCLENADGYSVV